MKRNHLARKQVLVTHHKTGKVYLKTVLYNPNKNKIYKNKEDKEYFEAIKNNDISKLREMVINKAKKNGFEDAIPEQAEGYSLRITKPPKKTITVYKTFYVDSNGKPSALFIGNNENIPMNVWVDAKDPFHFTDPTNGKEYVPSMGNPNNKEAGKTGDMHSFDEETKKELIKRGFITEKAKKVTALAYRPGWHAGDLPFFPQGGKKVKGSNYGNVHRWNQVVFEIEIDADKDYTEIAQNQEKARKKDGSLNEKQADLQYMPENGFYHYTTNPTVKKQTGGKGDWIISHSIKIKRALTEEECNKILLEHNLKPQEWENGFLDLSKLGYKGESYDAARKTLAPITYDDDGNIIPLSQRFNREIDDVRKSQRRNDMEFYFTKSVKAISLSMVKSMDFKQIKARLINHLKKQMKKEETKEFSKSLAVFEIMQKAAFPIGTIREWKGKKYIKTAPGKWMRKYDNARDRGFNRALKNVMRQMETADSPEELLQIVLKHSSRFRDENGNMLPEVQQLHDLSQKKQSEKENKGNQGKISLNSKTENKDFSKYSISELEKIKKDAMEKYKNAKTEEEEDAAIEIRNKVNAQIRIHNYVKLPMKRVLNTIASNEEKENYLTEKIKDTKIKIQKLEESIKRTTNVNNRNIKIDKLNELKENEKGYEQLLSELKEELPKEQKTEEENIATKGKFATDKQIDYVTEISNKKTFNREKMLTKPVATIQKYANSRVEDFKGSIDEFIEYMADRQDGISLDEIGKEWSKLINHNVARKIFEDYKDKKLVINDDGYFVENNETEEKNKKQEEVENFKTEISDTINSYYDEMLEYTDWGTTSKIKKLGEKKLKEIASVYIDIDKYKEKLLNAAMEKIKEFPERKDDIISEVKNLIYSKAWDVNLTEKARKKLDTINVKENEVDLPVSEQDMSEAKSIIGSDVDRILSGRDTYGNAKQTLADKIRRRFRNNPGVCRAMLVYIKQEQEKTGKEVFTSRNSIWELLPKLNENAKEAKTNGETETKTGVSGNIYSGDDGTTIVENKDWGRYQIALPGKPDRETITKLKQNGFRWSPSTKTWVGYNTANGERKMHEIAEFLGLKKEVQKSITSKVKDIFYGGNF